MDAFYLVFIVEPFEAGAESQVGQHRKLKGFFGIVAIESIGAVVEVGGTVVLPVVLGAEGKFPDKRNAPVQVDVGAIVLASAIQLQKAAKKEARCLLKGFEAGT